MRSSTLDPHGARAARRSARAVARRQRRSARSTACRSRSRTTSTSRGLRTTWGSRLYADFVPTGDELPVARLRAAGAVIVGKTNVPEFTLEGYTDNPLFGTTRNPWDLRADAGRLERRRGGRGRGGPRAAGARHRRRRLDPPPRVAHRARRLQAVDRAVSRAPTACRRSCSTSRRSGRSRARVDDVALAMQVIGGPDVLDRRSLGVGDRRQRRRAAALDPAFALRRCAGRSGDSRSTDAAARAFAALGDRVDEGPLPFDLDPSLSCGRCRQVGRARTSPAGRAATDEIGPRKYVRQAEAGRGIPATRYLDVPRGARRVPASGDGRCSPTST